MLIWFFSQGTPSTIPALGEITQMVSEFYGQYWKQFEQKWKEAVSGELFGNKEKAEKAYIAIDDLLLLGLYLSLVKMEQGVADASTPCASTVEATRTKYKLECVENYFKCYGINAKKASGIFGLLSGNEGIDFNAIEHSDCPDPIFKSY